MGSLQGRAALVTGAARRLGRAIAEELAREGADILVHYGRSAREAERTAEALRRAYSLAPQVLVQPTGETTQ